MTTEFDVSAVDLSGSSKQTRKKRRSKINRDSEQKKSKIQAFFKKQVGQLKKKNNL